VFIQKNPEACGRVRAQQILRDQAVNPIKLYGEIMRRLRGRGGALRDRGGMRKKGLQKTVMNRLDRGRLAVAVDTLSVGGE